MAKAKNIILVVGLFAVAGAMFWYRGCEPSPLPDSVIYACVETGQVVYFAQTEIPAAMPAKNPKTGRATLVPAEKRDGKLYMKERFRRLLDEDLREVNKHVDPKTFEIR